MSLNPFLHPRNPYLTRPNFKELAKKDAEFRKVAKQQLCGKVTIDFKDREAVRILTQTLLKHDFHLEVVLPPSHLVPTLPLRFNYLLWLEDLLEANAIEDEDVRGLDVGCGASCIYPLLAIKHLKWNMIATEANQDNFDIAKRNLEANRLQEKISLFKAQDQGDFFSPLTTHPVTFTMCNPPFYNNRSEAEEHGQQEESECDTSTEDANMPGEEEEEEDAMVPPAGRDHEMRTEGGEAAFIKRMLLASKAVGDKAKIFTCMIGHKATTKEIRKHLNETKEEGPSEFSFAEFCQGKTLRWGVAWSYDPETVLFDVSPLKQRQLDRKLHAPVSFDVPLSEPAQSCQAFFERLKGWLEEADMKVKPGKVDEEKCSLTVKTNRQGWKGQRRKRREKMRKETEEPGAKRARVEEKKEPAMELQLCCRMFVHVQGDRAKFAVNFIDGAVGKGGVHSVMQYVKNKAKGL